ncbi:SpoIIE family protein phosphatase [Streptomyces tendae]|uniref:ATP-binding SpoIIE family protein phosphatase n=1 Tax=Streptomyces tendae TaxID=1932 RepID=UPI0033F19593
MGEVALDTSDPAAEPGPEQSSDQPTMTVLSGPSMHAHIDINTARRNLRPVVLAARTEGLAAWDVFESLHDAGRAIVLLSWESRHAAQDFEREYHLPPGSRMQRVDISDDRRPAVHPRLRAHGGHDTHSTEQGRLSLLADSGAVVGASLDLASTAQALADLLVPGFADAATVDVLDEVVSESPTPSSRCTLRRVASAMARPAAASADLRSTPRCPPLPSADAPLDGPARAVSPADAHFEKIYGHDAHNTRYVRDLRVHSAAIVPLLAPTGSLGLLTTYRLGESDTDFTPKELDLAQELARRTGNALGNARAYARERDTTVALRRAAGPRSLPRTPALAVRHGFATTVSDGQWHDVIRLPGARTALIVGDASPFGSSAAVAATRLRTAARVLAGLETSPQELLARLNDLVVELGTDLESAPDDSHSACLTLVYDPLRRSITFANAGHGRLVVTAPGKNARILDGPPGPELGRMREKYSETRLPAEPGMLLALTGLSSTGTPPSALKDALDQPCLDLDACFRAAARRLTVPPDEAPLIVARTDALNPDCAASWDLASDIAMVSTARAFAERQLDTWGLGEDVKFVTLLVVSELVTNAVRHATAPVQLRLIRQEALTCEVSDGSSAAPYLQHAMPNDEGGRGLLIVAEIVSRWGVRRDGQGKTIWTEQELDSL